MMATEFPSGSSTVALRPPPTASRRAGLMPRPESSAKRGIEVGDGEGDQAVPGAGAIDDDVEPGRLGHPPHHLVRGDLDVGDPSENALEEVPARGQNPDGYAREGDLDLHDQDVSERQSPGPSQP
jgi:hypothetical protein